MTSPAANARFAFKVELYLNGAWRDVTADVEGPVTVTRGKSSEGNRADPGTCSLRMDNLSGDYSPRNPSGQWYGHIGRNTPLRVSGGLAGGTLYDRFYGEVPAWPPGWNLKGNVRWVDVEASGVLRRMGQGVQPVWSPLRRAIEATDPAAYWPMEDGVLAESAGGAVSTSPPMVATGTVEFKPLADYTALTGIPIEYGTSSLADLSAGGQLRAQAPAAAYSATGNAQTVHVTMALESSVHLSSDLVVAEWVCRGGTRSRWRLVITTGARTQVIGYDLSGTPTTVIDHGSVYLGYIELAVSLAQSGLNVDVDLWIGGLSTPAESTSIIATLGGITSVACNPTGTTSTSLLPFGHVAVWGASAPPLRMWRESGAWEAARSFGGEDAVDRLTRLCGEAGLPLSVTAASGYVDTPMGWQAAAALSDLIDECAEADGGMLFESRAALGLAYRPRASLYNQTPVTIDYTRLAPPFAPVDDVDRVRNDVTVKRANGSSARAVKSSGPLAVADPPDGVGVYRTEVELNLADDGWLADHAGWRLHLGTVDRERYPALSVQLAAPEWQADTAGVAALLAVDSGDVLEVADPPSWAAGDVRTLVTGYTETFDEWLWSITFAGEPAQPWDVAEYDGEARMAGEGSTLAASLTGDDVTPLNANPYFTDGTSGWSANGATLTPGTGDVLVTPTGAVSTVFIQSTTRVPVTAGARYLVAALVNSPGGWSDMRPAVDWWTAASGGSFISGDSTAFAVEAGEGTMIAAVFTAPPGAGGAIVRALQRLTPSASDVWYAEQLFIMPEQALQLASTYLWTTTPPDFPLQVRVGEEQLTLAMITGTTSPQTAAVAARGVNGVRAAWPSGTDVDVWRPAVVAL